MVDELALANPLGLLLDKERDDFTRADMLRVVAEKGIERFTFHHTGIDGQLKELRLPFSDLRHAEEILAMGERVDGSSLFKGLVDASREPLDKTQRKTRHVSSDYKPFQAKGLHGPPVMQHGPTAPRRIGKRLDTRSRIGYPGYRRNAQ